MKKVSGERFVAALIDAILVGILSSIPAIIYVLGAGGEGLVEYFMGTSTGATPDFLGDGYILFLAVTTYVGLGIGVLYFVYMPYKMNGQTLGKKVMKIKAIDEVGENPSFKQHFLRAVQNWGTYASAIAFLLILISQPLYSVLGSMFTTIVGLLAFVSYLMVLIKEDGRGFHDTLSGTRVVKADIDFDKDFIEKTTQMGEWAEVVDKDEVSKEEDPWKY